MPFFERCKRQTEQQDEEQQYPGDFIATGYRRFDEIAESNINKNQEG